MSAEVSVLARDPGEAAGLKGRDVNVVKGDYVDYESQVSAFSGIDKVLLIGAVSLASNSRPQGDEP
jgi:NAD(P)H dehydrogenase (quinone)